MELARLQSLYYALNAAHLADDELDHELQIRDVNMIGENRSKQERSLRSLLKAADIDYQYERLANSRRQGPREKFQDFYLDMVRIFRSMSRQWDDARKFDILFRNTRADCRAAMLAANVTSIPTFDVGQRVYKRSFRHSSAGDQFNAKLGAQYIPCTIVRKVGTSSYEVSDQQGKSLGIFSAADLKA